MASAKDFPARGKVTAVKDGLVIFAAVEYQLLVVIFEPRSRTRGRSGN